MYRIQKKQDSYFDGTEYTQTMQNIYDDCYELPYHIKRYDKNDKLKNTTDQPYDELFMWSLLLFSGNEDDLKLIRHFWSKTKFPLACSLAGIIIYKSLIKENFVPDDIKDKLLIIIKYYLEFINFK